MGIFEDIQKKLNEDKELQAFEAARGAAAKIKEAVSNAPQPKPSTASGVGTMSTDILGSRSGKKTAESTVGPSQPWPAALQLRHSRSPASAHQLRRAESRQRPSQP